MNLKEQKQYMKFMMNISGILDIPEKHLKCEMRDEQVTFYAYKNNQMKEVLYEMTFIKSCLNLFRVVKQVKVKNKNSWGSSSNIVETNILRYTPQSGAEFYDSDNNLYELNKSNHFNLSLDNDMILPYEKYRELYLEYKKMKNAGNLKISIKE